MNVEQLVKIFNIIKDLKKSTQHFHILRYLDFIEGITNFVQTILFYTTESLRCCRLPGTAYWAIYSEKKSIDCWEKDDIIIIIFVFIISCDQGCVMTPKHRGIKNNNNNNNIFFFSIAYALFLTESVYHYIQYITELVIQLWKIKTDRKILR